MTPDHFAFIKKAVICDAHFSPFHINGHKLRKNAIPSCDLIKTTVQSQSEYHIYFSKKVDILSLVIKTKFF